MKLYEITIRPVSGFGTPLKGDTLFGHFCWQAAYDSTLLNGGLEKWMDCYGEKPFAVFSTAWPKFCHQKKWYYAIKRPDVPLSYLFTGKTGDRRNALIEKKENAAKKWMLLPEDLRLIPSPGLFKNDKDIMELASTAVTDETRKLMRAKAKRKLVKAHVQSHNTINRLTDTTGEGMFAPYEQKADFYYPETELAVLVLVDEDATDIEHIALAMERIGRFGFGKDASTGWGRFDICETEEKAMPDVLDANACYTLSPALPEKGKFRDGYFSPFTRFGRHGDLLARSANPFKNPVIMVDEGAVLIPEDIRAMDKPYLGRPAFNVSKAMPKAVVQGYATWLPFKLEI